MRWESRPSSNPHLDHTCGRLVNALEHLFSGIAQVTASFDLGTVCLVGPAPVFVLIFLDDDFENVALQNLSSCGPGIGCEL